MHYILTLFLVLVPSFAFADDARFKGDCIRNGGKLVYSDGWQCIKK